MKTLAPGGLAGDLWGGLAAMLVALPAAIAFGVSIYAPLGPGWAAHGALAGIAGAVIIGLAAPLFGGTDRLISAPCAPAAAVMSALALELSHGAALAPQQVLVLMAVAALLAGILQVLYGLVGGGTLIKYIPYPVVTGYLSGVGLVIFLKQVPALFGWPAGTGLWGGLTAPGLWQWPGLAVGLATIAVMLAGPRLTRLVPAAILGLAAGVAVYFAIAAGRPGLLTVTGNPLVIGPLGESGGSLAEVFTRRWAGIGEVTLEHLRLVLVPALTLSVLLSIDTLKTCVVVDALTHSRHDSNREILGQGIANLCSAVGGGVPGAGTAGATLVNIASGGRSRRSSVLAGVFALVAFLALGALVAWMPIAALAGILVVVAYRMFDWKSVRLLRQRSTVLDFLVIVTVIAVAVGVGLVTASGVGVALAIILFIREQVRGSVIHRRVSGEHVFSRQRRLPHQLAVLEHRGGETLVCELQDNLFFGTTDQLFRELEEDLESRRYVILDMRRVRGVDYTGVHVLKQFEARLAEHGAMLLLSSLPDTPAGGDLRVYFRELGFIGPDSRVRVFDQLSDALEWVEDRWLEEAGLAGDQEESAIALRDLGFLRGRKQETLEALAACVEERGYAPGDVIFRQGDQGDQIYFVRRGSVRIELVLEGGDEYHIATFGRGDFFGDMAFLDRGARSANAVAVTPTELFEISRARFDAVAERHPRLARDFFADLARLLAIRLRLADGEIRALEDA